jgi:hypothetical protein
MALPRGGPLGRRTRVDASGRQGVVRHDRVAAARHLGLRLAGTGVSQGAVDEVVAQGG